MIDGNFEVSMVEIIKLQEEVKEYKVRNYQTKKYF